MCGTRVRAIVRQNVRVQFRKVERLTDKTLNARSNATGNGWCTWFGADVALWRLYLGVDLVFALAGFGVTVGATTTLTPASSIETDTHIKLVY